ncbi:MAG TPA: HAD-IA family hydrolase, partial [Candidatus Binataceae bacterium]|nr:HAD-IA family hydrolase [Candidatus Binataceae bacterium]
MQEIAELSTPTSKSMTQAWLLDFDGTIAQLEHVVDWAGGRRILEPYLRSVGAPEELFSQIPRGNLPLYDAYRARLETGRALDIISVTVLSKASEIIEQIEMAGVGRAEPLAGATDLIARLRAEGAKLAVVTSNSSRTVTHWFDTMKISRPIAIVGRDSILALKPSPAMIHRALELLSASPGEATFVGDSIADALAARAAGVRFFGIATG